MTIISGPHTRSDAIEVWNHYLNDNNPEDVWIFVENAAIKDALVHQMGMPVLGTHIATLQEFADHLVAERCPEIKLLTTEEQLILMHSIVRDSAWNSLNTSLSFVYELLGRYNFFRKNGISLDAYRGTATKHGILCDIFDRYTAACGTRRLDAIGILQKTIDLLQEDNPVKYAVIYHLNPTELLLQRLLDAIRSDNQNITEYPSPAYPLEKPATLIEPSRKYATARDEIESVLDQAATLIEAGCDPQDILILTPSLNESAGIIRDGIRDFYYRNESEFLPLTCSSLGFPLSSFPIIQCVMAALSTQLTGYRLTDLETVTASKYFVWPEDRKNEYIAVDRLRELSIIANVTEKEQAWKSAAFRLQDDKVLNYDAARIEPLISWLKLSASSSKSQTFAQRARRLTRWLAGSGWTTAFVSVQENKARDLFIQYLNRIAGDPVGSLPCDLSVFAATLRQFIQSKEVMVPAPNGIRLEKLRKAADLQAKHVFIIALTAENLPNLTPALSPFSVAETNELCRLPDGTPFSLPDRQYEETKVNVAAALQTATESLHLSCYLSNGSTSASPSLFLTRLDEPKAAPVLPLRHSVWYNQIEAGHRIRNPLQTPAETPLLGVPDTGILERTLAREQTGYSSDFSASSVQELFRQQYADREYYPTEIEKYLACPYRWYLDMHLRLRKPQDTHAEHLQLGILIHDALQDFFSTTPSEDIATQEFEYLYARLLDCVKKQFEREHILDSPLWESRKEWYLDRVPGYEGIFNRFLTREIGFAREGWCTTAEMTEYNLKNPDPVPITFDTKTMKIGGKIDRIMCRPQENPTTFRIVDYKTSDSFEPKMKKGELVQIPLYTEAYRVRSGLKPEPGYYFKLTKDATEPVPLTKEKNETDDGLRTRLLTAVFAARDRMSAGTCSRATDCDDRYCPYRTFCRTGNTVEEAGR